MQPLCQLVLAKDATINLATEHGVHVYLPGCKAGKVLAAGPRDVLESWRGVLTRAGYETRLVVDDPDGVEGGDRPRVTPVLDRGRHPRTHPRPPEAPC
jgi:hypothetical protein